MPTVNVTIVPADTRAADEGLYIHFSLGAAHFVAVCPDNRPPDGPVAAVTLIDQFIQDRADTIIRFRNAALHRRAAPDKRITLQRRQRLIESIRAIDGRHVGATYQEIAEVIFEAEPVSAINWKSAPLRDIVMRRVASGYDLISGGYRRLLLGHRPDRG